MAWTFEMTRRGYGNMWRSMTIKPGRDAELAVAAVAKILSLEDEYRDAFEGAGMPWYFGAAIHYREASNDLRGCMVNGEKIVGTGRRTTLVPENRGPYATFKDSVQDAATLKGWRDVARWSIEFFLWKSESWNGLGYVTKGINAPFVWAGTNHEERGLYVADHVFDANTEDTRLGVAAVVKHLMEVRPDIAREIVMETQGQAQPLPQPQQQDRPQVSLDLSGLTEAIGPLVLALLRQLLSGRQGQPLLPPPIEQQPAPPPVVVAPPPDKLIDRPSVQTGAVLTVATLLGQIFGFLPAAIGENATTTGQVLPILTASTALLGPTGSMIGRLIGGAFSLFNTVRNQNQPK